MAGDKWSQVKEILEAAIRRKPEQRAAFLDKACEGDDSVRREVESLLSSFGRADGFMETPAIDVAGKALTITRKLFTEGQAVGHYEITRLIGVGGMGEVYLAKDTKLDRNVAIKFLNKKYESHQENVRRFVQEAKAASALNHPNILTIHEVDAFEESHYIVSEYVEGKVLREILAVTPLNLSKVLDISIQITSALAAAHSAGIIHRDIKPENIVVRSDGYVKVLDFGLAKLLPEQPSFVGLEDETNRQNQTAKGLILGTISYMSPEQARGEKIDARTDIFSLGVVIYEMITGRTPFAADSMPEAFANLINKEPPPLSKFTVGVPDDLQMIVSKTLNKDRDERYQTMKALLIDLGELKDRITLKSKLERTTAAESEKDTAVLPGPTGDAPRITLESTDVSVPWYRHRFLLAVFPALLLGIIAFAWYWRQPSATPAPQIKSLAVLPLKSLDAEDNYLGFGVADAVIRRISQTGALTVRPTSAVRRYVTEETDALTAATELTVDSVLEGTVQRAGDRVRITVNLLRAGDGVSLWTERFDTQLTDIFAVQDKVAQQVAARLQLQLDPAQQARLAKRTTSDPVAYENYVKGVYAFNQRRFDNTAREQIDSTIDLLKKAIDQDPQYALAHAKLAHAYAWKGLFIVPEDQDRLLVLAQEEIGRADAVDPQLAETHLARFRIMFSKPGGWRIEDAVREILMAQEIDPNVGHEELSDMYLHIGLEDLMDREIRKALEIDPTSEWVKLQMLIFYQLLNRYDDYLKVKNEYFPEEPVSAGYFLVKGDLAKTKELLDEEEKKDPRGANPVLKSMVFAVEGRKRESEALVPAILKEINKLRPSYHHDTYDIACIYAVNGNVPQAMKWLRETVANGNPQYTLFTRDPFLDKIRQSPEFVQFMAELKPQYEKYRSEFH